MIVYIDMDDVLCQFSQARTRALTLNPDIQYPQSQYGFFQNLEPVEGALEAMNNLYTSTTFQPYILTAPSIKNPLCYTEKRVWVENHLGMRFVERLIISPNKGLLKGSVLIDDRIAGCGQESFAGEVLQFGSSQYPNWNAVLAKLETLGGS